VWLPSNAMPLSSPTESISPGFKKTTKVSTSPFSRAATRDARQERCVSDSARTLRDSSPLGVDLLCLSRPEAQIRRNQKKSVNLVRANSVWIWKQAIDTPDARYPCIRIMCTAALLFTQFLRVARGHRLVTASAR